MRYPKAGDLQAKTGTTLTSNPEENPYEVRSTDGGLEGIYANEDDALFYADELRRTGARGVEVKKRTRPGPARATRANPPLRTWREPYGTATIVIEQHAHGYSGWFEGKAGRRMPISFGRQVPESAQEAIKLAKRFLDSVHGKNNPIDNPRRRKETEVSINKTSVVGIDPDDEAYVFDTKTGVSFSGPPAYEWARKMGIASKKPRGAKEHTHMSGLFPNPDEDTFDSAILGGMAQAIWVSSWADWYEELSAAERRALDLPRSMSGKSYEDVAPEAPPSAFRAAEDIYVAIERANRKSPGELFAKACDVDGCAWNDENADLFGHYLAMQAMGHGVSWFDDHKEFPLKFPPHFEVHTFDGEEVEWSPQSPSRRNGVKR